MKYASFGKTGLRLAQVALGNSRKPMAASAVRRREAFAAAVAGSTTRKSM